MEISRKTAMKLWNDVFGENTLWSRDCFGTWIYRDDYGDIDKVRRRPNGNGNEYNYGWTVDHIMPEAKGGKDAWNNLEPMHYSNNQQKADEINFKINGVSYQVVKCNLSPGYGYGIKNQENGKRVDWKAVQNRWYVG